MVSYVLVDGQRVTAWMAWTLQEMNRDFYDAFGLRIKVRSGIRTYEDQKRIFLDRYVLAGDVRGRKVYDTRWWQGKLWYRISSAGTVAPPGSSNHEVQGSKAAWDLYDTGKDAGITVAGTKRANWLRSRASKYGLVASGYGFKEPWHYDVLNIFRTPPGSPAGDSTKEVNVIHYFKDDGKARRKSGMDLKPGASYWLHTDEKKASSQASNIVGGVGEYQFTEHVYAQGTPGDVLELTLAWDNTKTSGDHSMHFVERMTVDKDGLIRANVPFARAVANGFAVYARLVAPTTNKGTVKVTRFVSDALLF